MRYMNYALNGYKVKVSRFLVKDDLSITITECMDALVGEIEQTVQVMEFPCQYAPYQDNILGMPFCREEGRADCKNTGSSHGLRV